MIERTRLPPRCRVTDAAVVIEVIRYMVWVGNLGQPPLMATVAVGRHPVKPIVGVAFGAIDRRVLAGDLIT